MGTDVGYLVWLHSRIHLCDLIKALIKERKLVLHPILTRAFSVTTVGDVEKRHLRDMERIKTTDSSVQDL